MECPVCKDNTLIRKRTPESLGVHNCARCEGNWIRFDDYTDWHAETFGANQNSNEFRIESDYAKKENENISTTAPGDEYTPVYDNKQAKLCPDCGRILIKYRVHKELDFYLDHCETCNGVWLDKNEWEALKRNNLHDRMNSFFTRPWQKRLNEESARDRFEKHYIVKFGYEDYNKLKDLKEWVDNHQNRDEMLAFLMDDNPFKA